MTSIEHYRKLEEELGALLASLPELTDADRSEVMHFVDVDEYGLALETLVGIVVERGRRLSPEVIKRVRNLAALMDLTESPAIRALDQQ